MTLRRVLVVGSCLLMEWPDFIKAATPGCPCDYLVFNNTAQIPSSPPQPADAYDFQVVQIPLTEPELTRLTTVSGQVTDKVKTWMTDFS